MILYSMGDNVRYVVLIRETKSKPWELCYIVERKSLAWRTAHAIEDQEKTLGNNKAIVIVCLEADYDKGKIKAIRPPADFDLSFAGVVNHKEPELTPKPVIVKPKFVGRVCLCCGNIVPSNGAAQFSHLRKHLKDLVEQGKVSANELEVARTTPSIEAILRAHCTM